MTWRRLADPGNPENRNAGNGGDLAKHSVYAGTLNYLLAHDPWSSEIRVRECHAGRGMYAIPQGDPRRPLLECLYAPVDSSAGVALHDLQRATQAALGVWPAETTDLRWYSGSAVLNTYCLAAADSRIRRLELYEKSPDTRRVLRAVLAAPSMRAPGFSLHVFPEREDGSDLDGEEHIKASVATWDVRDLVVLDPFAMWRQDQDRTRRARYRRILEAVAAKGHNAPSLMLFWTWGRAFPVAEGDLSGTGAPVVKGYRDLRDVLHRAGRRFIRVKWRWGLQFAMWVMVPDVHTDGLRRALERECNATRDHLLSNGCGDRLRDPGIQVTID